MTGAEGNYSVAFKPWTGAETFFARRQFSGSVRTAPNRQFAP